MVDEPVRLIKGTVDVMVLKALSWGPLHGYAISRWIERTTRDVFTLQEGALYPALRRLEEKGLVDSEWIQTETGREARVYRLTTAVRRHLRSEVEGWRRYAEAMTRVLEAVRPREGP